MHKPSMYAAIVLFISAGETLAFTVELGSDWGQDSNGYVWVPLSGATLDLRIDILRDGSTNNIGGAQMNFVASAAGVTIHGSSGGTTLSGTGTRYNQAEWDASTTGNAQNPNTTLAGPMSPGVPRGLMGTLYSANGGTWSTGDSFFGILRITLSGGKPPGSLITLSPTDIFLSDNDTFEDVSANSSGITFAFGMPEPASALLMLAVLPFLRRRSLT